jgi:hypothetical protein
MGKVGSDRHSSPAGNSKFKPRLSSIKKHRDSDKRHSSNAPTGKYGFSRLRNDDGDDAEGVQQPQGGFEGGKNRIPAATGHSKKHKTRVGGSQAQAPATSVRSALKHVAVENLVAAGAKKSKLLQKIYDSDAFTGTRPISAARTTAAPILIRVTSLPRC